MSDCHLCHRFPHSHARFELKVILTRCLNALSFFPVIGLLYILINNQLTTSTYWSDQ